MDAGVFGAAPPNGEKLFLVAADDTVLDWKGDDCVFGSVGPLWKLVFGRISVSVASADSVLSKGERLCLGGTPIVCGFRLDADPNGALGCVGVDDEGGAYNGESLVLGLCGLPPNGENDFFGAVSAVFSDPFTTEGPPNGDVVAFGEDSIDLDGNATELEAGESKVGGGGTIGDDFASTSNDFDGVLGGIEDSGFFSFFLSALFPPESRFMTRSRAFFKSANRSRSFSAAISSSLLMPPSKRSFTSDRLNPFFSGERVVISFFIFGGGLRLVFGVARVDCDGSGCLNFASFDTPNAGASAFFTGALGASFLTLAGVLGADPNGEKLLFDGGVDPKGVAAVLEVFGLPGVDPKGKESVFARGGQPVEGICVSEETPNGVFDAFGD